MKRRSIAFSFDDPAEWSLEDGGGTLTNSGCWVYEDLFVRDGAASPYWPGCIVELGDDGPPRLLRVLAEMDPAELRPEPDPA